MVTRESLGPNLSDTAYNQVRTGMVSTFSELEDGHYDAEAYE